MEMAREVLGVEALGVLQVESVKGDIGIGALPAVRTLGRKKYVKKEKKG